MLSILCAIAHATPSWTMPISERILGVHVVQLAPTMVVAL